VFEEPSNPHSFALVAPKKKKKKKNTTQSLDLNWCQAPDRGLPRPDHVFFLTLSPDAQRARGGFGDERYETTQFQQAVATAFTSVLENTSASVTVMLSFLSLSLSLSLQIAQFFFLF
jgi:dTMP kinase